MSRRSIRCSFHSLGIAVALGSLTQAAVAADARDVPLSARTEVISAGTLGEGLHDVVGCVYDVNTGRKVEGPFVIRVFTREGTGLSALRYGGCYDGLGIGDFYPDAWDFIEVLYKKDGRLYSQQLKLSATATPAGFNYLGIPENTLRYDFYLNIVHAQGRHEDAAEPGDAR